MKAGQRRNVASLASYENGYPFKPEDFTLEGVPVVRIKQLNDPEAELDRFGGDVPRRHHLADGDLVFSWSGSLSVAVWDRGPAYLNQHLFRVTPQSGIDKLWLKYALDWSLGMFAPFMHGSAMTHITQPMMKEVHVNVPDFESQRRIADFLDDQVSRIDSIISARRQQILCLADTAQSALTAVLTENADSLAELRHLGVRVTTGPFGTVFAASDYVTGGVPMINPTHISKGELRPGTDHSVSESTAHRLSRHRLQEGDLVVSRKGDLGRTAMVAEHQSGWICGSDSIALHSLGSRINSGYLDQLLKLASIRDQLLANSNAVTMPSLSEGNLLSLNVPAIDEAAQVYRASSAAEIRKRISRLEDSLQQSVTLLTEYKQSLITAAVTGEMDVTTASTRIPA